MPTTRSWRIALLSLAVSLTTVAAACGSASSPAGSASEPTSALETQSEAQQPTTTPEASVSDSTGLAETSNTQETSETNSNSSSGESLSTAAAIAQLPAYIRDKGSITFSINPDVPPVKYLDSNNQFQGVIVDLLTEAGDRLGLKVEFQKASFDSLIPGLLSKRYDASASMGDFKERQEKVDFIDYLNTGVALLVMKANAGKIQGPEDLCGSRVAFVKGTAQQGYITKATEECEAAGKAAVTPFAAQDSGAAELALRAGQVDADWTDSPDAHYRANKNQDELVASSTSGIPYGIAFRKDMPGLRDAFRSMLVQIADDGTYTKILKKYGLGDPKVAMPTFPINSGPSKG